MPINALFMVSWLALVFFLGGWEEGGEERTHEGCVVAALQGNTHGVFVWPFEFWVSCLISQDTFPLAAGCFSLQSNGVTPLDDREDTFESKRGTASVSLLIFHHALNEVAVRENHVSNDEIFSYLSIRQIKRVPKQGD